MSWKKLFYAGAVLVLTACNNATAPSPSALTKLNGASVSVSSKNSDSTSVPSVNPITAPMDDCSSQVAHIGLDGQIILICQLPTPGTTISW